MTETHLPSITATEKLLSLKKNLVGQHWNLSTLMDNGQ